MYIYIYNIYMFIKICNICNVCICNVYVCNVYIIYMSRKKIILFLQISGDYMDRILFVNM